MCANPHGSGRLSVLAIILLYPVLKVRAFQLFALPACLSAQRICAVFASVKRQPVQCKVCFVCHLQLPLRLEGRKYKLLLTGKWASMCAPPEHDR